MQSEMAHVIPRADAADTTNVPTNDHHDAAFDSDSSAADSLYKSSSLDHLPDLAQGSRYADIQDAYVRKPTLATRGWWYSFYMMTVRARRKNSPHGDEMMGEFKDSNEKEASQGLLAPGYASTRRTRRKRSWFNYCVFGGISGLTILSLLLALNLILALATLSWSADVDPALQYWGMPGTGTEGLSWYPTDFTKGINPVPCHSHNDYWRKVPLFSALRAGCTGVEADVWLFDDDLFVGHNTASLTRNRTFTRLYVDPLVKILEQQNPHTDFYNGSAQGVFDSDPDQSLILLVDLKTGGAETLAWVLKQLQPLRKRGWLSFVKDGELHPRPVTVVGTGNTPFDVLTANTTYRDIFFDAPLETMWESRRTAEALKNSLSSTREPEEESDSDDGDNDLASDLLPPATSGDAGQGMSGTNANSSFTALNSYYASVSFHKAVGWLWRGSLTEKQIHLIRGQVRGAHRRGLKVRYWDLPSWPIGLRNHVWDVLMREGVDVLNVDDLRAATRLNW